MRKASLSPENKPEWWLTIITLLTNVFSGPKLNHVVSGDMFQYISTLSCVTRIFGDVGFTTLDSYRDVAVGHHLLQWNRDILLQTPHNSFPENDHNVDADANDDKSRRIYPFRHSAERTRLKRLGVKKVALCLQKFQLQLYITAVADLDTKSYWLKMEL